MNNKIQKTTLHPVGDDNTDLYPVTSPDQIVGLNEYIEQYVSEIVPENITDIKTISTEIIGDDTVNTVEVTTQKQVFTFEVTCKNGNGIVSVHALSHTVVGSETVTIIQVSTDTGNLEFEVHAENGKNGTVIKNVTFTVPSTATSGTLTEEVLAVLQENDNNYIIFDNEIYRLQDKQHEEGYLIYSHVGHNSTNDFMVKCITITINTLAWVLTSGNIEYTKKIVAHYMRWAISSEIEIYFTVYLRELNTKFSESDLASYLHNNAIAAHGSFISNSKVINITEFFIGGDYVYASGYDSSGNYVKDSNIYRKGGNRLFVDGYTEI